MSEKNKINNLIENYTFNFVEKHKLSNFLKASVVFQYDEKPVIYDSEKKKLYIENKNGFEQLETTHNFHRVYDMYGNLYQGRKNEDNRSSLMIFPGHQNSECIAENVNICWETLFCKENNVFYFIANRDKFNTLCVYDESSNKTKRIKISENKDFTIQGIGNKKELWLSSENKVFCMKNGKLIEFLIDNNGRSLDITGKGWVEGDKLYLIDRHKKSILEFEIQYVKNLIKNKREFGDEFLKSPAVVYVEDGFFNVIDFLNKTTTKFSPNGKYINSSNLSWPYPGVGTEKYVYGLRKNADSFDNLSSIIKLKKPIELMTSEIIQDYYCCGDEVVFIKESDGQKSLVVYNATKNRFQEKQLDNNTPYKLLCYHNGIIWLSTENSLEKFCVLKGLIFKLNLNIIADGLCFPFRGSVIKGKLYLVGSDSYLYKFNI